MRIVVLVVVGVEGTEAMAVETTTTTIPAKSVILKVARRISRDSCMIRVIRLSRLRNGEHHSFLRNGRMANSNSRL
jgi:hypothetical protein